MHGSSSVRAITGRGGGRPDRRESRVRPGGRESQARSERSAAAIGGIPLVLLNSDGDLLLLALLGFLGGLYFVYAGFNEWQRSRLIEDTPTAKVRSMSVGLVELEGTARPEDEIIHAPLTDEECVYVDWEAEKRERYEDDEGNTRYRWTTIASGTRTVPFALEDDTGTVTVRADLDDPNFDVTQTGHSRRQTLGKREQPPADVLRFVETGGRPDDHEPDDGGGGGLVGAMLDTATDAMSDDLDNTGQKRRYSEDILPIGSHAYVLGSARSAPGAEMGDSQADLLEVRRHDGVDEFLVSDTEEDVLQERYGRWGPIKVVGGIAVSAVCLFVLLGGA